jgi:hypothetical protein
MNEETGPHTGEGSEEELKWPIGFIVMVSLAALYLLVRLVQMAGWAVGWLF